MRTTWTDDLVESAARSISDCLGHFPSNSELNQIGRSDLANQIARRGGFIHWAGRIGVPRQGSDSDTGWMGEAQATKWLQSHGFEVEQKTGVKCPYDLIVDGCLRVEVKSSNFSTYGGKGCWHYCMGRHIQSDVALLWRFDLGDAFIIPWKFCPSTAITISVGSGKYARFLNNTELLRKMVRARAAEFAEFGNL